jgi:hypothetical protein
MNHDLRTIAYVIPELQNDQVRERYGLNVVRSLIHQAPKRFHLNALTL